MRYRKKPVEVEAVRVEHGNLAQICAWSGAEYWSRPPTRAVTGLLIQTIEGDMVAAIGDWIIKGVEGEFYPCKDSIFRATYEPVTGPEGE